MDRELRVCSSGSIDLLEAESEALEGLKPSTSDRSGAGRRAQIGFFDGSSGFEELTKWGR